MKRTLISDIIFLGIIIALILSDIRNLNQIIILNDEFGYWSIAAQWAGKDWGELIPYTPWYSFGYGVLLLPFLCLFKDPRIIYKAAIGLNIAMVILDYYILKRIGKKIFPKIEDRVLNFSVFVVLLYPSVLYQSQIAWTEILLYTLFLLVFYLIYLFEEKGDIWVGILVEILLTYMYMVHNRTIFICIVGTVSVIYIMLKKKISNKYILIILTTILVGIVASELISNYLIQKYWSLSSYSETNSVSFSKINTYLDRIINNIIPFIESLIGKAGYYLLVTGPIILGGIYECVKQIIKYKEKDSYTGSYFFLLSSFGLSLGVAVITFMGTKRLDGIVYSRYSENTIGVLLLLGIINIILNKQKISFYLISMIMTLQGALIIESLLEKTKGTFFNVPCAVGLGIIYPDSHKGELSVVSYVLNASILWTLIIFIGFVMNKNMKKRDIKRYIILSLIGIQWGVSFWKSGVYLENYREKEYRYNYEIILPIVNQYLENDLIYILDSEVDNYGVNAKKLQYVLMGKKINVIEKEVFDINLLEKNTILLLEKDTYWNETVLQKMELLDEETRFKIYRVK